MKTFEDLLREVESQGSGVEKTASSQDVTLELLQGLSEQMEKSASQERIMKYANAAGEEFAKAAADKFAQAVRQFMDVVNSDAFAEKVANLIIEKLAVDTSDKVVTETSTGAPKENPQDSVEKDQKGDAAAQADKREKEKQKVIDAEGIVGAQAKGSGDLLSEKSAALDALSELLGLYDEE